VGIGALCSAQAILELQAARPPRGTRAEETLMSAKLSALFAFAFGAIIGVAVGCQRYDFQPVEPIALSQTSSSYSVIAKKLKPNIMLVVDNSGSMYLPINPNAPTCTFADGGLCGTDYTSPSTYCPSGCPTRTSELRRAMAGFFADAGTVGRFGLTTFPYPVPPPDGPWDTECNTGIVRVPVSQSNDVDAELQATATQINNVIQNDTVGGGTPTGATLRMLADNPGLQPQPGRDSFVLLETDGVPNCNANNALNTCANGGCADQNGPTCMPSGTTCPGPQGTCSNGACGGTCGGLGLPCCHNGVDCTAPQTTCQNGACVQCGGAGQPCCPGPIVDTCASGYICGQGGICH